MTIPTNTVNSIAKMVQEVVEFGNKIGIYNNTLSLDALEKNIVETCFSNKRYTSCNKNKFLSVQYPEFYMRKSSSGLLAKSSIIQFSYNNDILTISFPVHLKNRIIITATVDTSKDSFDFVSYYAEEHVITYLKKEILNSVKLSLKKYKVSFEKDSTFEELYAKIKIVKIISF